MANNPYVNKVQLADGTPIIDISNTTATAESILAGYGAYGADGAWIDGTATSGGGGGVIITDETDEHGGTIRTITAIEVTGTKTITSNGTGIDVTNYAAVNVSVPQGGGGNYQSKSATPTESQQTISPDSGYDALSSVTVGAISSSYVGSGVARKSSTNLTASGATVTAPAGYYAEDATKTVASGSATAPATISGTGASVSAGTNTLTLTKTVSVTPSVSAGYVSSGTAGDSDVSLTASVNTRSSSSLSVSGATVTAPSGYYASSASASVASGTEGTPSATKGTVSDHSVTVTPSVTNTAGYISGGTHTGTGVTVTVSELESGTKNITANGTGISVSGYSAVNVAVPGDTPSLQEKTGINPSTSSQTIEPDEGYDGLSSVQINAMPSMTLPTSAAASSTSGYTSKATISRSTSDQYINIPTGYNAAGAYYKVNAVANGSVTAPASISGSSATVSTGTNTLTLTKTVSVTPSVTSAGYISSGTAGNSSVSLTASVNTQSSSSLTASGATVTAPAGYYASDATKSVSTMTLPTSATSSSTSGYTSKATISRSTSDQYINIPTGYNTAGAYYKVSAVANGSATAPASISGSSASVSTGTNTLTLSKTVSVTPSVTAGYVSSGTAGNSSVSLTASVTTKAAATYYPSTSDQEIAASQYLTGKQTIKAVTVSGLSANTILSGTTVKIGDSSDDDRITSVSGSVTFQTYYTGSGTPSSSLGVNGDIYLKTS